MTEGARMFSAIRLSAAMDVGLSVEDAAWQAASEVEQARKLAAEDSIGEPVKSMLRYMLGAGECGCCSDIGQAYCDCPTCHGTGKAEGDE